MYRFSKASKYSFFFLLLSWADIYKNKYYKYSADTLFDNDIRVTSLEECICPIKAIYLIMLLSRVHKFI